MAWISWDDAITALASGQIPASSGEAAGALAMGAAPSRSETDAPDGRGRHGERW